MRHTVIIAGGEDWMPGRVQVSTGREGPKLELAGVAADARELISLAASTAADIAVVDADLPGLAEADGLAGLLARGLRCAILVVDAHACTDGARAAIRAGAADYLAASAAVGDFDEALVHVASEVDAGMGRQELRAHREAIRALFFSEAISELEGERAAIESIDRTYCARFKAGLFRVFDVKLDFLDKTKDVLEGMPALQCAIREFVESALSPFCYDIIQENRFSGVIALINYPASEADTVKPALERLRKAIDDAIDPIREARVTICVGRAHANASEIAESRNEALNASWARLLKGEGKVLYDEATDIGEEPKARELEELSALVRRACDLLDVEGFRRHMEVFFGLGPAFLGRQEARKFSREIKDYLFDTNGETISSFADINKLYIETRQALSMASTIREYKEAFISQCTWILERLIEAKSTRASMPVRAAMAYVKRHFDREISVDVIAMEVGLSPVYFSYLFKKETGENFTSYVTERRIEAAKDLLKKGALTVKEISRAVGFGDQRYFSKTFKRIVGARPTEYRALHC